MDINITAGLSVALAKDESVTIQGGECGAAFGTYTTNALGEINFDIDPSSLTCEADSLAVQLVQYLNDAARWHFANGYLVIELPADGRSLIFAFAG